MENAYIIQGGQPLHGEVHLSGAKNVALKVIIASLLCEGEVRLSNIPHILDIKELLHLITLLGVRTKFVAKNEVIVDSSRIVNHKIDLLYASKIRVSFMLFAPLLARFGRAKIPNPGGCRLGARPIDRTVAALKSFGVKVAYSGFDGYYRAKLTGSRLSGCHHRFNKVTHTGTELAILLGAISKGNTVLENVSREPEIDDLISFLNQCGAHIKRFKDNIYIKGVLHLKQQAPFRIQNDRNEAVTYAVFALATKGSLEIKGVEGKTIASFLTKVKEAGGVVKSAKHMITVSYKLPLKGTDVITGVHPGFMTDWQAPWAVAMTQAVGVSTIHETVFENRFSYVDELRKLGAKIDFFQPYVDNPQSLYQFNYNKKKGRSTAQAIRIVGGARLHNAVLNVSDLRAGASLLIAASVAAGETVIRGASVINRGYEDIDIKLKKIGARIRKI